jgi:hypothetical protein
MCRNIRILFNFEPPATEEEIRSASLQYVRKVSGTNKPSAKNQPAFDRAVEQIAEATRRLMEDLTTTAPPRNREIEREKARERSRLRFAHEGAFRGTEVSKS